MYLFQLRQLQGQSNLPMYNCTAVTQSNFNQNLSKRPAFGSGVKSAFHNVSTQGQPQVQLPLQPLMMAGYNHGATYQVNPTQASTRSELTTFKDFTDEKGISE